MIVVLNGSVGVGKTSVAWALHACLEPSVMLDGDYLGAVNPFDLYDARRVTYLYDTLVHVIAFHQAHAYKHFVLNYVFETPESLKELTDKLAALDDSVHVFWLRCDESVQAQRITERNNAQVTWEMQRFAELNALQTQASQAGFIGHPVDTTQLTAERVARFILTHLHDSAGH